jgi:hypothetical protein
VWQALRTELHPLGLEIVTVGMDTAGPEACRPFIEAAAPEHPSLVDVGHLVAERFGVVNIPNGLWIDEDGTIVRPAEPAPAPRRATRGGGGAGRGGQAPELPERMAAIMQEAAKIETTDPQRYEHALRDWVAKGADSAFALSPDEVVARSGDRDEATAEAAAHFALAQHLYRAGDEPAAVRHFREAHRLQPENISYKRQAWSLAAPGTGPFERFWQGPVEGREEEWPYESDWLSEVRAIGPERYYRSVDLAPADDEGPAQA